MVPEIGPEFVGDKLVQADSGLNPLACYPFWQTWYESPGMTKPLLDPTGRIWINPGSQNRYDVWRRLRNPVPAAGP
jgi:hypothetical protein